MSTTRTRAVAATAVAGLALSLSACGGTDTASSSSSDSSSSASSAGAPAPVAAVDSLTGKTTAIKLDSSFTDALSTLKLTPGVVGDAKLSDGSLVFPITGGNVTYFKPGTVSPYVIGQIQHEGSGLSLAGGGTKVQLTNLNVDPGASRVYGDVSVNGKVAATSAYLFTLDGRYLKPLQVNSSDGTAVLTGTHVEVSGVAADLLNKTFGTSAVKEFMPVGIATITINTQSGDS